MTPAGADAQPGGKAARRQPVGLGMFGQLRIYRDEGCLFSLSSIAVPVERHAASVCFALGREPLELRCGGETVRGTVIAVEPFCELEFDSGGEAFAMVDVLPMQAVYRAFRGLGSSGVLGLPADAAVSLIAGLREFHRGGMPAAPAYRLFRHAIDLAASRLPTPPAADARVVRAVWRLYRDPTAAPEAVAAELGLSLDRLSHLFALDMGFPLRRYVQAAKVVAAGRYVGSGKSLTEIAVAAGFADLAHFSKVWRRCYGMSPAFCFQSGAMHAGPPEAPPPAWS